jgi:glycosyltransferase involved in cell wall biosynthesis
MTQAPRRIGISLGNISGLQDGLGEFASQIGRRVAAAAPEWRERHGIVFDFHLRDRLVGLFGDAVGYLTVNRWQRFKHVRPQPYALWHSLHQLNKTLPPAGSKLRLATVHDLNYRYGSNSFSRWRHDQRTHTLLNHSDHLVAISQYTAADIRQHLGWNGPLEVILNGAQNWVGRTQKPLPGWPLETQATGQRPFLFHLSRMSPSKNPQAIVELAKVWPQMQFVLCGPTGHDSNALRARTHLPNVEFHLGIDDAQKAWAYARCAGFIFPSLTEGFGLPPIEAMHFGKPVFLSTLTSLPEVGGVAAFYFEDFDPAAMRQVVERGLALHAQHDRGGLVQQHAARFNWDATAQAYLALYSRLLRLPQVLQPT